MLLAKIGNMSDQYKLIKKMTRKTIIILWTYFLNSVRGGCVSECCHSFFRNFAAFEAPVHHFQSVVIWSQSKSVMPVCHCCFKHSWITAIVGPSASPSVHRCYFNQPSVITKLQFVTAILGPSTSPPVSHCYSNCTSIIARLVCHHNFRIVRSSSSCSSQRWQPKAVKNMSHHTFVMSTIVFDC